MYSNCNPIKSCSYESHIGKQNNLHAVLRKCGTLLDLISIYENLSLVFPIGTYFASASHILPLTITMIDHLHMQ